MTCAVFYTSGTELSASFILCIYFFKEHSDELLRQVEKQIDCIDADQLVDSWVGIKVMWLWRNPGDWNLNQSLTKNNSGGMWGEWPIHPSLALFLHFKLSSYQHYLMQNLSSNMQACMLLNIVQIMF